MTINMAKRVARIPLGTTGMVIEYRAEYPHVEARALRHGAELARWADLPPGEVMYHLHGRTAMGRWLLNALSWDPVAYAQWAAVQQFHLMNDAVTLADAAERLNRSPQALYSARRRHRDSFPAPCSRAANAALYRFTEIESWYAARAR